MQKRPTPAFCVALAAAAAALVAPGIASATGTAGTTNPPEIYQSYQPLGANVSVSPIDREGGTSRRAQSNQSTPSSSIGSGLTREQVLAPLLAETIQERMARLREHSRGR